jgi:hypothetical protein
MLETFTAATFAPLTGEKFRAALDGAASADLTLSAVDEVSGAAFQGPLTRQPFSLVFHGPQEPRFHQGTYQLEHPAIGSFALFLVPISPDEQGPRYQAVFN